MVMLKKVIIVAVVGGVIGLTLTSLMNGPVLGGATVGVIAATVGSFIPG